MKIVMLAPPGGGKGTVAEKIVKEFGYPQISTGDLLRDEIKRKTEIGKKTEKMIQEGKLVPDDIVLNMIRARTSEKDCKKGFILDGFPRNIAQAKMLEENNISPDLVIQIKVKDERVIKRISGRRLCRDCGEIFNIFFKKPKKEGVCDKCGSETYQRADDNEESVKKRLDIYRESTAPLVEYYKKKGVLKEISGDYDTIPPVVEQAFKVIRES